MDRIEIVACPASIL